MNEKIISYVAIFLSGSIATAVVCFLYYIRRSRRAQGDNSRIERLEQRAGTNNRELADAERTTREAIERARETTRRTEELVREQATDNRRAADNNRRAKELIERAEKILNKDVD